MNILKIVFSIRVVKLKYQFIIIQLIYFMLFNKYNINIGSANI